MGNWGRVRSFASFHWPLGIVLFVALVLRTSNLFPLYFYGDDAEYATVARSLADDPRALAYPDMEGFGTRPFVSQPPLILYFFALATKLTGSIEAGPVLVSVLLGTATCGLVYALGVGLRGRSAGTLAGLLLAVLPPHVILSRKAFLDVGLTFFMTLAVLCFLIWTQRRSTRWAVATGAAAGATILSKLPGVLILVPLAAGFAYGLWWHGRAPAMKEPGLRRLRAYAARRADLRHATWALVPMAAMGFAYLFLMWYLRASRDLLAKVGWNFGRVAVGQTGPVGSRADPPWHWYFTDGGQGVLSQFGIVVVLLGLVGLGFLVWHAWREPAKRTATLVLLAWPLVVLLVFTLSHRKEWFYLLPIAPPAALFASFALGPPLAARLDRWLATLPVRRMRPGAAGVFALGLVVAIAVVPSAVEATRDVVLTERTYGYGVKEAAAWIHENDPDAGQIGTLLGRFTLKFYNDQPTYHWYVPHPYVHEQIEEGRVRYLVWDDYLKLPYETQWMEDLVLTYDGELVQEYEGNSGRVRVRIFELHPP